MRSEPEDKEHILAKRSSVILGLTMQELEADGCHCEDGCEVAVLLVVLHCWKPRPITYYLECYAQ